MKITENNVVQQLQKRNEDALHYVIDHYGGIVSRHLSQSSHELSSSSIRIYPQQCMESLPKWISCREKGLIS